MKVDTIIDAGWVIPVRPDPKEYLTEHSIAIHDGKILDVLPTSDAHAKYTCDTHLDRKSCILLPGFVNAHTHAGMTLLRGKADDMSLLPWLHEKIWPMEAAFSSQPEFCRDSTELAIAEMIKGGVTLYSDMYFFSEATAPLILETGIRAVLGIICFKFPSKYAQNSQEYLNRGEGVHDQFKEHYPQLLFAYCPHAPYTVETADWKDIKRRSEQRGLKVHTHLHETKDECAMSKQQNKSHPACHLSDAAEHPLIDLHENVGLVNKNLIAVHMVHLTEKEMEVCNDNHVNIVHCPTSNGKLASGFCNTPDLLEKYPNINVSLGTDSACSNNSLDLRSEMKVAALNAKNLSYDPAVCPAWQAIEMATYNGAKTFDLEHLTGSIEAGKLADIVCIEVDTHAGNTPTYNPHAAVVYSSERSDVKDVLVNGKFLYKDRNYCTLDIEQVKKKAKEWEAKILKQFPQ